MGGGWDVRGEDDGLWYPCAAEVSLRIEIGRCHSFVAISIRLCYKTLTSRSLPSFEEHTYTYIYPA
jgi:hypothetical protein